MAQKMGPKGDGMKRKTVFTINPNDRPCKTKVTIETTGNASDYGSADLLDYNRKIVNGLFEAIVKMCNAEEIEK